MKASELQREIAENGGTCAYAGPHASGNRVKITCRFFSYMQECNPENCGKLQGLEKEERAEKIILDRCSKV